MFINSLRIRTGILFFIFLCVCLLSSSGYCQTKDIPSEINTQNIAEVQNIVSTIVALRSPVTGLTPSHWNHPGYQDVAFIYDKAVDALVLNAAGMHKEAEAILDYFATRLAVSNQEVLAKQNASNVFGIIKTFSYDNNPNKLSKAVVNAININSHVPQGEGILEFYTTPGPQSFLIFAFLSVNPEKYLYPALGLGDVLLTMQGQDGGMRDGDRSFLRVHTEPHMDAFSAFLMLYSITKDRKWFNAAEKAWGWFKKSVYYPDVGKISQGVWEKQEQKIFATDVYSWTMSGPAGDRIPVADLKRLTEQMLMNCMVRVSVPVPGGLVRTVVLSDFSNPMDPLVQTARGGIHPVGSVEWTGGVILVLQKNAARLWNSSDLVTSRLYKAVAENIMQEALKSFYPVGADNLMVSFYASAQGTEVAPFGAIDKETRSGWKTPFFYVKNKEGKTIVAGGSSVSVWPLLPYFGANPFILKDEYRKVYDKIPYNAEDKQAAFSYIENLVKGKQYKESTPSSVPDSDTQINEPKNFNRKMWEELNKAQAIKESGNSRRAAASFKEVIRWALMVTEEPRWVKLAKEQNILKAKEMGGLIIYNWGATYPNNDHPTHWAILRYPLVNEMGVAMWGLAVAYFELGEYNLAKLYMKRIIEEVPLHQIPVVDEKNPGLEIVKGYWNAIDSWERNVGGLEREEKMRPLYQNVLRQLNMKSALPKYILLPEKEKQDRENLGAL